MRAPVNTEKIQGRRFRKGQSGNPAGRPRGSRNKTTLAVDALLDGEAETLTRKAIEKAKDGDVTCLRLARCKPTSAIRTFSTRSATLSCPRRGLRIFGETERGLQKRTMQGQDARVCSLVAGQRAQQRLATAALTQRKNPGTLLGASAVNNRAADLTLSLIHI